MTKSEILSDLAYVKSVAEEGRNAPLLGGRIGLMWTALLAPTLFMHGLAAKGIGPIPVEQIGLLWMGFGITGGILAFILVRTLRGKPGGNSLANKIESIIWPANAILIFSYAIALGFSSQRLGLPHIIFDTIIPFAFATGAINLLLLGKITGKSYLKAAGWVSGLAMIGSVALLGRPELYFAAAAGVVLTGILPSLLQLKDEPH